ncbi:MAG TPA: LysR family transcriptional regulator [Burkholderiales bacterium]|nr:LysR family transcriptional regulator [Burkholderiales bacterium]
MLDDIALFVKLVDVGSFSQVAKLTDSTQATISRRIQNLEADLGVVVLKRNQRGLVMTDEGRNLYEQVKSSVNTLQNVWQELYEQNGILRTTLRLALTTESARDVILQHLPKFLQENPNIKLHITFTTQQIHLIKQNYDLAITSELPSSSIHNVILLRKFHLKAYASPNYIVKYGNPQNLAELLQHRCIGSLGFDGSEQDTYQVYHAESSQNIVVTHPSNLYMDTTSHAIELAKSGEYITGAWDSMVQNELARGELVSILPELSFVELPCYLVRNSERKSKQEQILAKFIEQVFASY